MESCLSINLLWFVLFCILGSPLAPNYSDELYETAQNPLSLNGGGGRPIKLLHSGRSSDLPFSDQPQISTGGQIKVNMTVKCHSFAECKLIELSCPPVTD